MKQNEEGSGRMKVVVVEYTVQSTRCGCVHVQFANYGSGKWNVAIDQAVADQRNPNMLTLEGRTWTAKSRNVPNLHSAIMFVRTAIRWQEESNG